MTTAATMEPSSEPVVRRSLKLSIVDGMFHAIMVGVGESYFAPLAVELGHRGTSLAILVTAPPCIGSLVQLLASPLARMLGARKRVVLLGVALQMLSLVLLAWIALSKEARFSPLFGAECLFWSSGLLIAPAWGAWMASLVSGPARERYFAWRSTAAHFCLLGAFVGGGFALHHGEASLSQLGTLAILFSIGIAARSVSLTAIFLQADPHSSEEPGDAWLRLRRAARTSRWKVAMYVAGLAFGAHLAVPFFTPYMLRTLGLDYRQFATLAGFSVLAKVFAFPLWHRVSRRFGLRPALIAGGIGVALTPWLWAQTTEFSGLLVANAVGGASWAAVEYASYQLLLQSAEPELRIEFLSVAAAISGLGQVAGGLVGGRLMDLFGATYVELFWISAFARAVPLMFFVTLPKAEWPARLPKLFMRIISVRPAAGVMRRPIVGRKEDEE